MRRSLLCGLVLLSLLAAACGDDDDPVTETTISTVAPTSTVPDSSSTTASTTTTPESTTTSAAPVEAVTIGALSLQPTGLGDVGSFGDDGDAVLLEVSAAFSGTPFGGVEGGPDEDSGWHVDTNDVSPCNGQTIRRVRWGDLTVVLADQEAPVLQGWVVTGPGVATGLTTPEGIARGATDAEVRATYGDGAFGDEGIYTQIFVTSSDSPAIRGIMSEADTGGVVDTLDAGTACLGIAS